MKLKFKEANQDDTESGAGIQTFLSNEHTASYIHKHTKRSFYFSTYQTAKCQFLHPSFRIRHSFLMVGITNISWQSSLLSPDTVGDFLTHCSWRQLIGLSLGKDQSPELPLQSSRSSTWSGRKWNSKCCSSFKPSILLCGLWKQMIQALMVSMESTGESSSIPLPQQTGTK